MVNFVCGKYSDLGRSAGLALLDSKDSRVVERPSELVPLRVDEFE